MLSVPKMVDIPKADGTKETITYVFWCDENSSGFGTTHKGCDRFDSQGKLIVHDATAAPGPAQAVIQGAVQSSANATVAGAIMGQLLPTSTTNVTTTGSKGSSK